MSATTPMNEVDLLKHKSQAYTRAVPNILGIGFAFLVLMFVCVFIKQEILAVVAIAAAMGTCFLALGAVLLAHAARHRAYRLQIMQGEG